MPADVIGLVNERGLKSREATAPLLRFTTTHGWPHSGSQGFVAHWISQKSWMQASNGAKIQTFDSEAPPRPHHLHLAQSAPRADDWLAARPGQFDGVTFSSRKGGV